MNIKAIKRVLKYVTQINNPRLGDLVTYRGKKYWLTMYKGMGYWDLREYNGKMRVDSAHEIELKTQPIWRRLFSRPSLAAFIFLFSLSACKEIIEVDGHRYELNTHCIQSHQEVETTYHTGYYYFGGDAPTYGGHYPWQCGSSCTKTVCDLEKTDTILLHE